MPTSNLHLASEVIAMVHEVPHRAVLDVGPGWGKYATLLREYLNERPDTIDCVELHAPYVLQHRLGALYDRVHRGDACELPQEVLNAYDVVLLVDVIEHMDLEAGLDLLERIPGRAVICTPVEFFSNGPGLPDSETHRSHWTEAVWVKLGRTRELERCYQSLGGWLVRTSPRA